MSMVDLCIKRIQENGWLSLSSLYFDNSYVITIYASRGYVAYDPTDKCFIASNCMDSSDTANIENRFNVIYGYKTGHVGMQQTVTFVDDAMLQHFDTAMYCHYCYFRDDQTDMPYPKIPTEDELRAFVKPEKPKLVNPKKRDDPLGVLPTYDKIYEGEDLDRVVMLNNVEVSTVNLYKEFEEKYNLPYSGAVVGEWLMWYDNHKKFVDMLSKAYGISGAI